MRQWEAGARRGGLERATRNRFVQRGAPPPSTRLHTRTLAHVSPGHLTHSSGPVEKLQPCLYAFTACDRFKLIFLSVCARARVCVVLVPASDCCCLFFFKLCPTMLHKHQICSIKWTRGSYLIGCELNWSVGLHSFLESLPDFGFSNVEKLFHPFSVFFFPPDSISFKLKTLLMSAGCTAETQTSFGASFLCVNDRVFKIQ